MDILKIVVGMAVVAMAGSTAYADEASVRDFRDKSEAKAYLQEINVGATCDQSHIADSIFIVNYRVDYPYRYENGESVRLIVEPKDGEGVRELFIDPKSSDLEAGGYTIPTVEGITTLDVDFIKQDGEWKRTKTIRLSDLELETKKVKIKVKD